MNFTARTDLACESDALHDGGKPGTVYTEERGEGYTVARLSVQNAEGEKVSGKKQGQYITVFSAPIWEADAKTAGAIAGCVGRELAAMIGRLCEHPPKCVLVVGLGNREITADNIGPKTVDKLTVTRHIRTADRSLFDRFCRTAVCAVAPGVVGQTGIETADLVGSVCVSAEPELVLVIDALAARSAARLGATVQIADSGICPGSGVGNHRREISQSTLGLPVIAIGVPTVVDSATLVYDALQKAGENEISPAVEAILREGESYFVSPRECDRLSESVSDLLAAAIDGLYLRTEEDHADR